MYLVLYYIYMGITSNIASSSVCVPISDDEDGSGGVDADVDEDGIDRKLCTDPDGYTSKPLIKFRFLEMARR